jgi:hypothetical protein
MHSTWHSGSHLQPGSELAPNACRRHAPPIGLRPATTHLPGCRLRALPRPVPVQSPPAAVNNTAPAPGPRRARIRVKHAAIAFKFRVAPGDEAIRVLAMRLPDAGLPAAGEPKIGPGVRFFPTSRYTGTWQETRLYLVNSTSDSSTSSSSSLLGGRDVPVQNFLFRVVVSRSDLGC